MNRLRRLAVAVVALGCLAIAAPAAVAAPAPASGTFVEHEAHYLSDTFVGDTEVLTLWRNVTLTGTYRGTARAAQVIVIPPEGLATSHIVMQFRGRVCGELKSLVFRITVQTDLFTAFSGTWKAYEDGRLQGGGTLGGVPDQGGDYVGQVSC
jgi:hypothetical protein